MHQLGGSRAGVLAALLLALAAALGPGADGSSSSALAIEEAPGIQDEPAVASDGTNHLVVWRDTRSGVDISGARVTSAGTVLDPDGIPITTAGGTQQHAAVAFDGTNFLVVWEDCRNGPYTDVYAARVNPAGDVLDPDGIAVSTAGYDQLRPKVAFGGQSFLVTWQDGRTAANYHTYAARVTTGGNVLDPAGLSLSTSLDDQKLPAVAFGGAYYLVAWTDSRRLGDDIYGTRVTPTGGVLDPNGIPIAFQAGLESAPAVAFDGVNYLVIWEDLYRIAGSRVSQEGHVLDAAIPTARA